MCRLQKLTIIFERFAECFEIKDQIFEIDKEQKSKIEKFFQKQNQFVTIQTLIWLAISLGLLLVLKLGEFYKIPELTVSKLPILFAFVSVVILTVIILILNWFKRLKLFIFYNSQRSILEGGLMYVQLYLSTISTFCYFLIPEFQVFYIPYQEAEIH